MTEERLFRLSCRAARDVLAGLERGDLERASEKLGAMRHYLALAETIPAARLQGEALYRREQMDLLAGVAEGLAHSMGDLQAKLAAEIGAFRNHRQLLRHAVMQTTPAARSRAAGCI